MKSLILMLALLAGFFAFSQTENKTFVRSYNSLDFKVKANDEWVLKDKYSNHYIFVFNSENTANHALYFDGELMQDFLVMHCCETTTTDEGTTIYSGRYMDNEGNIVDLYRSAEAVMLIYPTLEFLVIYYNE